MPNNVSTFLLERSRLSREGLRRVLSEAFFEVVGEGSDLDSLERAIAEDIELELILFDQPDQKEALTDGLTRIRELSPNVRVVVLSDQMDPAMLSHSFAAGADGFLLKDISCEGLIESLRLVLLGEKVFPSSLTALLVRGGGNFTGTSIAPALANGQSLSEREQQILQCLVAGNSNKVIANRLEITEATVKVHLKSILRKINASNRTQAAIWAYNHGMGVTDSEFTGRVG
jgi:two-component system nitrate/nitrite response regulator NarL